MNSVAHLGHVEVLDVWGKPVFFRDLWNDAPTVLVLVRHFGCLYCHEHADTVVHSAPSIEALGARLVLLGNGNPKHAGEFMRRIGLRDRVYTDPARILYRALGMRHGMLRVYNFESSRHLRRATQAGYRNQPVRGDRWQLGGTLVIQPTGDVAYRHVSEVAGEHGSVSDVLRALERVRKHQAGNKA
jgi:peroxiredoxin